MPKVLSPKTDDGEYDVRAFGAKGDGSTDDTAAINAALQKCYDDGGGTVRIRAGNYKTSNILIIRQDTTLICDNNTRIFRSASGSLIMNGDYDEDQSVYTGHGNIRIVGGVWDMMGTTVTNGNIALAFAHGQNISIEGVTIKDVPMNHAIEVNSCKTVRIRDCRFLGYYDSSGGATVHNEAVQIDLALTGGGTFGAFGLYDDTPCSDVVVEGCYFGASGTASTVAWYRGVGTHSGKINFPQTDIRIVNNHFDSLLGYAIGTYGYENCVIAGNVFDTCASAVLMDNATNQLSKNITIVNNVIKGSTDVAVASIACMPSAAGSALVQDLIVSQNSFTDIAGMGIQVSRSDNTVVSDNVFRNVGGNAIYGTNANDVSITDNNIKAAGRAANATHYGIRLSTSVTNYRITDNRIRKFGSGNEVLKGLSVTSTCTGGYTRDNDIQDTGYDEQGTSRATSDPTAASAVSSNSNSTAATSFGNLTTAAPDSVTTGPAVTVETGASAIVILSTAMVNNTESAWTIMGCAVSGASTISANDARAIALRQMDHSGTNTLGVTMQTSFAYVQTGLTPGSNTFTCQYRVTAGTGTFLRRALTVIPI